MPLSGYAFLIFRQVSMSIVVVHPTKEYGGSGYQDRR